MPRLTDPYVRFRGRRRRAVLPRLAALAALCAVAVWALLTYWEAAPAQPAPPPAQSAPAPAVSTGDRSEGEEPPAVPAQPPAASQEPVEEGPAPLPEVPATLSSAALPEGEAQDKSVWFAGAVMLGDSRVDGFRIYAGANEADYIYRTGMNVYEVADGKQNIRVPGGRKASALELLGQKQYTKVYLSIGVNELGYADPEGYGRAYGEIIDQVRALQPDAAVYVQAIIPVCTQMCREHEKPEYISNETIAQYNDALVQVAVDKGAFLVDPGEAMTDETGEGRRELYSDGVHFSKEGYVLWRDYLLCHTGIG